MKILIIDNEANLRSGLKELIDLSGNEQYEFEEAPGVTEGLKKINSFLPDIVFLDVEMEDGSGFDLLKQVTNPSFQLIFVTAHNQYAIDAFRFSAIDYLLKPADPEKIAAALERAKVNIRSKDLGRQIEVMLQQLSGKSDRDKRIVLKDIDNIYFVKLVDILYCMAEGTYTKFFMQNGNMVIVSKNLKEYENILEPSGFIRTHHSYLVNPDKINMYDKTDGGALVLEGGHTVPISQRKKDAVMQILEKR
jgi:two-component system, LytTR family, response regulator